MSDSQWPDTLDLGCGNEKLPGALGMDVNPRSAADLIHNLDDLPWPIEDNVFLRVRAQDVLEHVENFVGVMEEIWRVCRPGALVDVRLPFMTSVHFHTDPTHRRAGTHRTFDYFDPSTELGKYAYSKAQFRVLQFHYLRDYTGEHVNRVMRRLDRWIVPQCQRSPFTYEMYFAGIYPMQNIQYLLQVSK